MKLHETYKFSSNFIGSILSFRSVSMHFVDLLLLSALSKVDCRVSVSFRLIKNFEVSNFAMPKVKKANIADT
jgi:hypothetical protein